MHEEEPSFIWFSLFQIEKEDKNSEIEHLKDKLDKNELLVCRLQEEKETLQREHERLAEKYERYVQMFNWCWVVGIWARPVCFRLSSENGLT